ncbi:hypothetical protein Tco_0696024 [Tanacetum coccineum]
MESKEDPKEDPQENSEEEGELKKKRLKKASESYSNTLPPDYTAPNEETETDLDSTAKCEAKPKELKSTFGAISSLTWWIEKMESVMDISGCVNSQKVKYAISSLINKALTWWNTQIQTRGCEAALGMTWEDLKALLVEEFYPSNEMEKLETEF